MHNEYGLFVDKKNLLHNLKNDIERKNSYDASPIATKKIKRKYRIKTTNATNLDILKKIISTNDNNNNIRNHKKKNETSIEQSLINLKLI